MKIGRMNQLAMDTSDQGGFLGTMQVCYISYVHVPLS
jgi:hypothetical protein